MTDPLQRLRDARSARQSTGLARALRPRAADAAGVLDLAGNDYLGLARDPRVTAAAADAARTWGAGATGSRLVTGSTALHADLEAALAAFTAAAAALVFSSGYLANLAVVGALGGPDVAVVSDASNHASMVDACRLSRSRVVVVPHADVDAVGRALAARAEPHALVLTEGVFSVHGDLAPVAALHAVARRHGALLVVDEAHSLGVVGDGGRGAMHDAGLAGEPDVVRTVTLSKALGGQGGAVLGAPEVAAALVDTGRPFIFDTGLAPASAGAALAALRIVAATPGLAAAVRRRAAELGDAVRAAGLPARRPDGAVLAATLGAPDVALRAQAVCAAHGVRVGCFRPPSVPAGQSCLRLTARADLTDTDLAMVVRALDAVAGELPVGSHRR